MVDYREILRLNAECYTQRQIAPSVGSSRNTVSEVINAAEEKHVAWPLEEDVTNEELQNILFPGKYQSEKAYAEPNYTYIHTELSKPGVTMTLLWSEYCDKCYADGKKSYMSTQFGDKYRRWARITKATMRIQHKPGDTMEVDWAGNTLTIYDPVTGEESKAYLFVAVLPCSCYTYAEICPDMKLETWLLCHVHAYGFFGGSTRLLISDNLKTGVTSNTRYETVLNKSYHELAEYYGTAIVPARVRCPKDKSHAEGGVNFASTWILAALRNQRFFSLREAEDAVKEKLAELNIRLFKKMTGCRKSAFQSEELEYMRPLPVVPYEPAQWLQNVSVGYDYLVSDGLNKYSVPFDLIGEKVGIRVTKTAVEVFFKGNRVAVHIRESTAKKDPIINPNHMTPEHKKYLSYNAADFQSWGDGAGKHIGLVVKYYLSSVKEPEQGFKPCVSLQKLTERYGKDKIDDVCKRVLEYTKEPSIRIINTLLKSRSAENNVKSESPDYHNQYGITRGESYFRKVGDSK